MKTKAPGPSTEKLAAYGYRWKVGDVFTVGGIKVEFLPNRHVRITRPASMPVIVHRAPRTKNDKEECACENRS